MTTIGMYYDVIPGKEAEFVNAFAAVLDLIRTMSGHVESHLYENVASKGSYVILSEWKAKADFTAFITSDAFRKTTSWGKAEILRGRPRHKVYADE